MEYREYRIPMGSLSLFFQEENSKFTLRISSINSFLSPRNTSEGPLNILLAETLSDFKADRQRAKTASPIRVTGIPKSNADMAVHFPVPFYERD